MGLWYVCAVVAALHRQSQSKTLVVTAKIKDVLSKTVILRLRSDVLWAPSNGLKPYAVSAKGLHMRIAS